MAKTTAIKKINTNFYTTEFIIEKLESTGLGSRIFWYERGLFEGKETFILNEAVFD
jgi:hypothetical protein